MSHHQIRFSKEFSIHLEKILSDLQTKSEIAANNLRNDIKTKLLNLKNNPFLWSKVISPVEKLAKYRRIITKYDYLIFYIFDAEVVYIVDIYHGRQDYWHLLN